MKLSVIIVTWNSASVIFRCLRALQRAAVGIPHEILVVDNHSSDNTMQLIRKHFTRAKILPQRHNWGFGHGNNIGIQKSHGTYILLLNPDTTVNRRSIRGMIDFLYRHPGAGVVGPEQADANGRMIFTVNRLSFRGIRDYVIEQTWSLMFKKQRILFSAPYQVPYLNAGCILIRRKALPQYPYFDPELFIYGEEFDFFPKVRRNGWSVVFLRNFLIRHYRGVSIDATGQKRAFAIRSFSYLLRRWLFRPSS